MNDELKKAIERMHKAVQRHEFATIHVKHDDYAFHRGVNIELRAAVDALLAFTK